MVIKRLLQSPLVRGHATRLFNFTVFDTILVKPISLRRDPHLDFESRSVVAWPRETSLRISNCPERDSWLFFAPRETPAYSRAGATTLSRRGDRKKQK
jgi:hypothetical protein